MVFLLELVMEVCAQAAGNLLFELRSPWLALPGGGRKPHRGFLCPPSDSLPSHFVWVMGVCALAAGSWPNRLTLPLANAPRAAENCPPDSFLIAAPTPYQ